MVTQVKTNDPLRESDRWGHIPTDILYITIDARRQIENTGNTIRYGDTVESVG